MSANPILLDFPDHFQTERLLVRCPRPGDGQMFHDALVESLDTLMPWMKWVHPDMKPEESESWARKAAAWWMLRERFSMLLLRQTDGMLVGSLSAYPVNWDVPSFELGYWGRTATQGQGYITEALTGANHFLITHVGAKRLELQVDVINPRSIAVAERAGYTREARFHHDATLRDGSLADTYFYALIPDVSTQLEPPA